MYKRNRLLHIFLIIIVISLGLLSRKFSAIFPPLLNIYLGDALWALMIFLGFALVFNKLKTKFIALFGLLFCYFIEFSQLYHAPWIDAIRQTTLGGLILGYGFLWSDLLAYIMGITLGIALDLSLKFLLTNYQRI